MKYLITVLFLLAPLTGQGGEVREHDDDGTLRKVYNVVNGKREGKDITYHKNGKKQLVCTWKNDELHGSSSEWDEKGVRVSIEQFIDGKRDGHCIYYHDNGKIESTGRFKNDVPVFRHRFYYKTGVKKTQVTYDGKGEETGRTEYNEKGKAIK